MALRFVGKQRADNLAVLIGCIFEALVILHVPEKLGMTGQDVGHLSSLSIIAAGAIRSMVRSWLAAGKAERDDEGA